MLAIIYNVSDTLNNKVNLEKLDLEIRASIIENYNTPPYLYAGKLYIELSQQPTDAEKLQLTNIIAGHDGEYAAINEEQVKSREQKIRDLTEMALYHPDLVDEDTVAYLTSIDNHFNGWKRSGVSSVLQAKIVEDAQNTNHPQHAFLNTVVNTAGNKTFEYLISIILS